MTYEEERERKEMRERISHSPSYRIAYRDIEFLSSQELRPARIELELQKAELAAEETTTSIRQSWSSGVRKSSSRPRRKDGSTMPGHG